MTKQTQVRHYQNQKNQQGYKTIHVLEGREAFISQDQAVPTFSVVSGPFWQGVLTNYQDVESGMWLVPYLRGGEVEIKVITKNQIVMPSSVIALQKLATTVSVPLGQWTMFGGASTN